MSGNQEHATKFRDGLDMDLGERIENSIEKIRFLADCFTAGKLELSDDGRAGCYLILTGIAEDLEDAINETHM